MCIKNMRLQLLSPVTREGTDPFKQNDKWSNIHHLNDFY